MPRYPHRESRLRRQDRPPAHEQTPCSCHSFPTLEQTKDGMLAKAGHRPTLHTSFSRSILRLAHVAYVQTRSKENAKDASRQRATAAAHARTRPRGVLSLKALPCPSRRHLSAEVPTLHVSSSDEAGRLKIISTAGMMQRLASVRAYRAYVHAPTLSLKRRALLGKDAWLASQNLNSGSDSAQEMASRQSFNVFGSPRRRRRQHRSCASSRGQLFFEACALAGLERCATSVRNKRRDHFVEGKKRSCDEE
eukprot:1353959-Pleurochrysis_carterae.AAC.2